MNLFAVILLQTLNYSSTAHEHTRDKKYDEDHEQDPSDLRRSASNTGEPEHRRDETNNEKRYRPIEHNRSSFPHSTCASFQDSNCYAIHDRAESSSELLLLNSAQRRHDNGGADVK
jgi:hypothetical protein